MVYRAGRQWCGGSLRSSGDLRLGEGLPRRYRASIDSGMGATSDVPDRQRRPGPHLGVTAVVAGPEPLAPIDRFRRVPMRRGGRVQGIVGDFEIWPGWLHVKVASWLPRFVGGGTIIDQYGGTVQMNNGLTGGVRIFVTDGAASISLAFRLSKRELLLADLHAAGFETVEFRQSSLTIETDFGRSVGNSDETHRRNLPPNL